ncbi:superinfection immunity protein [Pseudomonas tritici]|uniref:superinfection immunity protein n=1 Tax=Pseudomonas tritici TaxID=2745518 RepID=UPI00387B201C
MGFFGLAILIPVCAVGYLCKEGDGSVAMLANILFISSAMTLYFLPSICAFNTPPDTRLSIFKLNLLAGWTGIGWILAFYKSMVLPLSDH